MATLNYQYSIFNEAERSAEKLNNQKILFHWNFVNPLKIKALEEIKEAINKFRLQETIDY